MIDSQTPQLIPHKLWQAMLLMLCFGAPVLVQADCVCYGTFAEQQACQNSCTMQKWRNDRERVQDNIPEDLKTVVPDYLRARQLLRETPSTAPNLPQVFLQYEQARERRDTALLHQYLAQVSVEALLTNGVGFKILDDRYEMPEFARPAFHDYAHQMFNATIDIVPNKGRVNVHSRYPGILDEAELQAWAIKHGGVKPQLVFGRIVFPKAGEGKPLDELTPEDRKVVGDCNAETNQKYPTAAKVRRDRSITDKSIAVEAQNYYRACMAKSCKSCSY
ncbi:hypothetical protein D3C87_1347090 [compost metagenome]